MLDGDASPIAPRTMLLLVAGLLLAGAGHAAWYTQLDASERPFLSSEASQARSDITSVFPNATPPTIRVVLEADDPGAVVSSDVLASLAGLRNRLSSDANVTPALAHEDPISSVLDVLVPWLGSSPGTWSERAVDLAIENATALPQDRRALAAFLDEAASEGSIDDARATVLVIRLDATASEEARLTAEDRVRELALELRGSGLSVWTESPEARTDAARSAWGWWVPAGAVLLVPVSALAIGARPRRLPAWVLLLLAGAGTGLLAGAVLASPTPSSLLAGYAGAGIGLGLASVTALTGTRISPPWLALFALAPLVALVGWAPAGTGAIAAAASVAAWLPMQATILEPGALGLAPRGDVGTPAWLASLRTRGPQLAGPLIVAVLLVGLLAGPGVPDRAQSGWQGSVPEHTDAGSATRVLESGFGDVGPGAQLAVASWGPVAEPGFLTAMDESSGRLERLSLAASGETVGSVLSLARDWASEEGELGSADRYDPGFAQLWENATRGSTVPVRNVTEVLSRLAELDPDGMRNHLSIDQPASHRTRGVALLRQQLTIPDVVPRPTQAVDAATQPLVVASDRVAVSGSALDGPRSEQALIDGLLPVALAQTLACLGAGLLWSARARGTAALGLLVGVLASGAVLATLGSMALAGVTVRPLTLLAPAMAGTLVLGIGVPSAFAGTRMGEGDEEETRRASAEAWLLELGWRGGLPLVAIVLAGLSAPAPGLQMGSGGMVLAVLASGLLAGLGLGGLVRAWERSPGQGPRIERSEQAHLACPVCDRRTATGATRCNGCGRWNIVEACPAHPDALSASCARCGEGLEEPRFR